MGNFSAINFLSFLSCQDSPDSDMKNNGFGHTLDQRLDKTNEMVYKESLTFRTLLMDLCKPKTFCFS